VQLQRPLFPGYVFCRMTSAVFGKVLLTAGVMRLLGFGTAPAEIPAAEIESLQRVNATDAGRAPWMYMPIGTRIRIDSGPLQGLEGICLQRSSGRRLVLSVHLLQRSVAVTLDPEVAIRIITPG
jgi:transcription antitermination factor NusG